MTASPELNFRRVAHEEFALLWPVIQPVFAAGETYPYDPASTQEQAADIWCGPEKVTYICEREGKVLGTYYIRANQPGLGNHICNAGFIVAPAAAGQGIGRAMGEHALSEAKKLGYEAMQFNLVVEDNVASLKIWEKLGFEKIGKIPEAFRHTTKGKIGAYILYRKL